MPPPFGRLHIYAGSEKTCRSVYTENATDFFDAADKRDILRDIESDV